MTALLSCRPNLEVTDLGPLVTFLRDVLGFSVDLNEEEMGLALLTHGPVGLAVVRTATPGVNATTACYVEVAAVDALHDRCVAAGATIANPLTDHPWGLRDFVVEVPGGHRVAFGQRLDPS